MILQASFAALASLGFAAVFHVKGKNIFFAALVGGIGYLVYLAIMPKSVIVAIFLASVTVALCSEIMARIRKAPATLFSVAGMIPIVPGAGMYNSMLLAFTGKTAEAITACYDTLLEAGAIAMGIIAVSSLFTTVTRNKNVERMEL